MSPQQNTQQNGRLYSGMSGDERRLERLQKLLEAGVEAFGTQGFAATTTRSLCATAGLTQRYFYAAFSGLEDLFLAVSAEIGERLLREIHAAMKTAPQQPLALAEATLRIFFRNLQQDPRIARILLIEVFTVSQQSEVQARRYMRDLAQLVEDTVALLSPHLEQRNISIKLLADGLIGAAHQTALTWMQGGYREPLEEVVQTALFLFQVIDSGEAAGKQSSMGLNQTTATQGRTR